MQFEGTQMNIPIKGINRAGADSLCEDGAMNEVIGLEYKDGSYVPYAATSANGQLPSTCTKFFVHKTSIQNNVVIIDGSTVKWIAESTFYTATASTSLTWNVIASLAGATEIEPVGNMLCAKTTNGLVYAIFGADTDGYDYTLYQDYNWLEGLPRIQLKVNDHDSTHQMSGDYNSGSMIVVRDAFAADSTSINLFGDAESAAIASLGQKAFNLLRENGRLAGYVIAVAAYKLKTGEYVAASSPILLGKPHCNAQSNIYKLYVPASLMGTNGYYYFDYPQKHISTNTNWDSQQDASFSSDNIYAFNDSTINSGMTSLTAWSNDVPSLFGWFENTYGNQDYRCMMTFAHGNSLWYNFSATIDDKYKGIIDSCCIFLSKEINPYKEFSKLNVTTTGEIQITSTGSYKTTGYNFVKKTEDDIKSEIDEINNFYKVCEIPYSRIKNESSYQYVDLEGKLGDKLYVQERLPNSAFDYKRIVSSHIDSYNYRLHAFNYSQKIFNGYDYNSFLYQEGSGQQSPTTTSYYLVKIKVNIKSDKGETIVWKDMGSQSADLLKNIIGPIITYPDSNAYKMTFYISPISGGWYQNEFELKSSLTGGFAYYNNLTYIALNTSTAAQTTPTPTNTNDTYIYKNQIKVSDTYAPNVFPSVNTYTVGNSEIVGIATLSIALSQDTYGTNPLLLFTTDGIYTLSVDSTGSGVYNICTPFSREVCINRNTICEIDGAVVFASSKGLMVATAEGVQEFTPHLNGVPKHTPQSSSSTYGYGLKAYYDYTNNSRTVSLNSYIDTLNFLNYLQDANTVVAYVSVKNKVLVYNKNKSASYFIDIPTRNTTKLPISFLMNNNNYPAELYAYSYTPSGSVYRMFRTFEYLSATGNISCLLCSRPIKLAGGLKTSYRVIIRGYFTKDNDTSVSEGYEPFAYILVLGSLDGTNWQPIGYNGKTTEDSSNVLYPFHDLGCVTERTSFKYMMIIFAGRLNRDSHIDGIEITADSRYNNKLR